MRSWAQTHRVLDTGSSSDDEEGWRDDARRPEQMAGAGAPVPDGKDGAPDLGLMQALFSGACGCSCL